MNNSNLVQKSIRLPADIIDFIDEQKGANFSDKLIGILDNCIYGDERRKEELARDDRDIRARERRLAELGNQLYDASALLSSCVTAIKKSNKIIEEYETETK